MLVIIEQRDLILRERDGLLLHPEGALIDPDRHLRPRQASLTIELPILKAQKSVLVQMPDITGRKQNAAENRFRVHLAFLPAQGGGGTVAAILTAFLRPMALVIVIVHPSSVKADHLFPGSRPF